MILDDILKILKKKSNQKAYTIGEKSYTYAEFYKYVSNIYEFLLRENIQKKPVVIYGHKEVYMKTCMLASSMAGMTYVPIDESIPNERIKLIIDQVKPGIILGDLKNLKKKVSKDEIYDIMEIDNNIEINQIFMKPEDIYYIIFTSGSTGVPKGVKVTYNNLDSCINWLKELTKIENKVILNQANFSFDLSVADLYLSLITESEHYIIDSEKIDYKATFKSLEKSDATLAVMTPSYTDLLLLDKMFNQNLMPKLERIIFCGEKLNNITVEKLYKRFDSLKIINTYGPTECTFAVTSYEVPRNADNENYVGKAKEISIEKSIEIENEIPVGKPKSDVEIYIVDESLKEKSEEEIGEILISGESVANGYLGNVINNSFISYKGKNAYLTGDLGYLKNGILYYQQRKDKQIKYKGYRIELSDIENNLLKLKYIEKAVVVAKKNEEGKVKNIIAFVKTCEEMEKIKKDLKKRLPEYMIPKIKIVDSFPINNNGKCDEKKLLEELG